VLTRGAANGADFVRKLAVHPLVTALKGVIYIYIERERERERWIARWIERYIERCVCVYIYTYIYIYILLLLSEIQDAENGTDFVRKLAVHPLVTALKGKGCLHAFIYR